MKAVVFRTLDEVKDYPHEINWVRAEDAIELIKENKRLSEEHKALKEFSLEISRIIKYNM